MKNLIRIGAIIILAISQRGMVHSQNTEWSVAFNGSSADDMRDMAIDPWNNSYVVGRMSSGSVGESPVSMNGSDIFLAKINPAGNVQWVVNAGGGDAAGANEGDFGWAVEYDSTSNAVYVAGSYQGTTFGNQAVFGPGIEVAGKGSFLAKYDTSGTCLWMRSSNSGNAYTIAVQSGGDVFVSGRSLDTTLPAITFHGPPVISIPNGTFVAKYSTNGQLLWAKQIGDGVIVQMFPLGDHVLLAGGTLTSSSPTIFGQAVIHNAVQGVAFIGAVDTSFTTLSWSSIIPSNNLSRLGDVCSAGNGRFLLCGAFSDSLFLPSDTLFCPGPDYCPFVIGLDSSGTVDMGYGISANTRSDVRISSQGDGSYYLGFSFDGSFTIPTGTFTANNALDLAVVRCNSTDGTPIGALNVGEVGTGRVDVQTVGDGSVIAAAEFNWNIDLGDGHTLTGSYDDLFVAKFRMSVGVQNINPTGTDQLLIYANPNNGQCTVELPANLRYTPDLVLTIFDTQGRRVQSVPVTSSGERVRLDISAQAKGSYIVELTDGEQRYGGTIVFE